MAAGNRSPLGFFEISVFHLCLLSGGVLLQIFHDRWGAGVTWGCLGAGAGVLIAIGLVFPRFYWDVFRSLKSAAVLLSILVLSSFLGTAIIQDLDMRRAGVFDPGYAQDGEPLPPFDENNQSTRFALAESHAMQWLWPSQERTRLIHEKVRLSGFERDRLALWRRAFGANSADAYGEALRKSKERQVEQLTTSNYARQHHPSLYRFYLFCRKFHLIDIFEAWWFYILLGLIAVNVIVGTIALAPWNARQFGVAITHAGILTILAGALLDLLVAKEGYIYFKYGDPQRQTTSMIGDDKNRVYHHLPFRVHLERFATEYYHEMAVERYDWSRRHDGSKWPGTNGHGGERPFSVGATFPIRAGITRLYEDGKIRVTVREYKPRVFVHTIVADGAEELNPAVKLALFNNPRGGQNFFVHGNYEPWLFAFDERRRALDLYESRFEYVWATTEAQYRELLRVASVPDNGVLIARRGGEIVRTPVKLGASRLIEIGGEDVRVDFIDIQSALADAENVNLDRRLQRSEEPLLLLRVNGQGLSVPRDDSEFMSRFDVLAGVDWRFDWPDPKDQGVKAIYRVVEGEGLPPTLVQAARDGRTVADAMRRGRPVALTGLEGGYLGLDGAVRAATERREVREVTDAAFLQEGRGVEDSMLAAWAKVEVAGPWGTVERELTPFDRPIFYGPRGERPVFAFALVKAKQERDWFSVLSVIDKNGKKVKSHPVQVNSPLRYGGYRFFQATAATDSDGLGISGISVTKNPGVNFMYVGYTVLTLGVCYVFFARPIIDRRRRKRRART